MNLQRRIDIVTFLYFLVAATMVLYGLIQTPDEKTIVKPLLLPILAILYIIASKKYSWMYLTSLFFAVLLNTLFLFSEPVVLYYGVVAYSIYRILTICLVIQYTEKWHPPAFAIAIVPFLFTFFFLINLAHAQLGSGIYFALANALILSVLAALSLSNYIFEDNTRNSWLLISVLLFVVLFLLTMIERFFVESPLLNTVSVVLFTTAYYTFNKYILLCESGSELEDETATINQTSN